MKKILCLIFFLGLAASVTGCASHEFEKLDLVSTQEVYGRQGQTQPGPGK